MPTISMDIDDAPPAAWEGADGAEHAGRAAGDGSWSESRASAGQAAAPGGSSAPTGSWRPQTQPAAVKGWSSGPVVDAWMVTL
jgi:hypothetical protein